MSRALLTPLTLTYAGLVALHDLDHVLSDERLGGLLAGFWVVIPIQWLLIVAFAYVIARDERRAPAAALLLGLGGVSAFATAHLAPFGPQVYADADPAAHSWALLFVPMAVATALAAAALLELRRRPSYSATGR